MDSSRLIDSVGEVTVAVVVIVRVSIVKVAVEHELVKGCILPQTETYWLLTFPGYVRAVRLVLRITPVSRRHALTGY